MDWNPEIFQIDHPLSIKNRHYISSKTLSIESQFSITCWYKADQGSTALFRKLPQTCWYSCNHKIHNQVNSIKQFQPEFDDSRGHHGNSTKVTSPGLDIGSGHCRDDCFWFFVPLLRHHCIIEIFSNQLPNWLSPCWGIRWTFLAHPLTPSHMLPGLWKDCNSINFRKFNSIFVSMHTWS